MATATVKHGPWGGPYTKTETVPARAQEETPGYRHSVSGYGKKIPTAWVIEYGKRWRRVYATVYSNAGTLWVVINNTPTVIEIDG